MFILSIFIETNVCARGAHANAINAVTLRVSNLIDKPSKGYSVFKKFKTIDTSHVNWYLGKGGFMLKIPLINLETRKHCEHQTLPKKGKVCNNIDLCVLRTE